MRDPLQDSPETRPFSNHSASLVPWHEGTNELDTRMYAWYYGKTQVISLPQFRPMAIPNSVAMAAQDGREFNLPSYLINDSNYVRLHDLAYALRDLFTVAYNKDGRQSLFRGYPHVATGTNYSLSVSELWRSSFRKPMRQMGS